MKRFVAVAMVAALAAGLTACAGGQVIGSDPTPTPTPTRTHTPSPSPDPVPSPDPIKQDDLHVPTFTTEEAAAVSQFAGQLSPLVLADETAGTNPAWSPLSAYLALAMVHDGARGTTAEQLTGLLGGEAEQVNEWARGLIAAVDGYDGGYWGPTIDLAAGLWADDQIVLEQTFIDQMDTYYSAGLVNLDLQGPDAAGDINGWISDNTDGLINGLVPQISDKARIFGATALYFDGKWLWLFDPEDTRERDFTLASGQVIQAEMMSMSETDIATLALDDGSYGAILPYKGERFAMVAVVPAGGVDSVTWDGDTILNWVEESGYPGEVSVVLPKWDIQATFDLTTSLQALGVTDVFDQNLSDLSGIGQSTEADEPSLVLSQLLQATTVQVDESGTKAASVTVWSGEGAAAMPPSFVYFDRPFVYAIVDTDTYTPLFIGVMNDPTATL
ncbi:MAG: hypothetical protein LBR27_09315 [Bifidobacteriaceae bacterium]|jgi:serpin B|nr:hypothetical protein [Bifidobacteriaceae bacterium]